MRVHVDVLGWLFVIVGAMGMLTGAALAVLAVGTAWSVSRGEGWMIGWAHPLAALFATTSAAFLLGGATMTVIGRALGRRRPGARVAALLAAVVNLCLLPFGTALGVYAFWVLINDEARHQFGRPPRSSSPAV